MRWKKLSVINVAQRKREDEGPKTVCGKEGQRLWDTVLRKRDEEREVRQCERERENKIVKQRGKGCT